MSNNPRTLDPPHNFNHRRNLSTDRSTTNNRQAQSARLIDSAGYYYAKRTFDITLILLSAIWLLPLLLVVALLIKLDSPGPVFFVHERVGAKRAVKEGAATWVIQNFPMFKFRSMAHNVDQSLHQEMIKSYVAGEIETDGGEGPTFKIANDPRITRLGRILRRTSIDELPQLLNVLRGEMSLIGPRPVPEYETELYSPNHFERLSILPGMTGLWQINGRGDLAFDEMIDLDIQYTRSWTFGLDLKILLMTVPCVLFGRGAE